MTCKTKQLNSLPYLLTVKDLMALLGVSKGKAYELCNGLLSPATYVIAGKYKIMRDEVFPLIEALSVSNTI